LKIDSTLDKMFDDIRSMLWLTDFPDYSHADNELDPSEDTDKDAIEVSSMMKYLVNMGVNAENCEIFVVLDIVQAHGFGQITRRGYVDGWKATG
jgi:DCN1-like protein 1/2